MNEEVLLIVIPRDGRILNDSELEILIPIIEKRLGVVPSIENNRLKFCEANLEDIMKQLNNKITEVAIVRQTPKNGPEINHRVFYFAIVDGLVEVRITEICESCNYEKLIEYLK